MHIYMHIYIYRPKKPFFHPVPRSLHRCSPGSPGPQEIPGGSLAAAAAARVDGQRAVEVGEEDLDVRRSGETPREEGTGGLLSFKKRGRWEV